MKVAAIQHDIVWENPAENFARLAPMIARAAADELTKLSELHDKGKLSDQEWEQAKAKIVGAS